MSRQIVRAALIVASIAILGLPIAAAQERSRTEGLKETERFVKNGAAATEAVATAKLQVSKTLDAYNALVTQPTTNMKGDYKKLIKSMDSMNAKVAAAAAKVDQMQQAGDTYFAGRGESIKNIQDQELRDKAAQRMSESQKQFGAMLQALREASQALDPFRKEVDDQITYLGSDLTPSAMTSLKPNADKLNAHGTEVFEKADKAIADANAYFQSLKSSES